MGGVGRWATGGESSWRAGGQEEGVQAGRELREPLVAYEERLRSESLEKGWMFRKCVKCVVERRE